MVASSSAAVQTPQPVAFDVAGARTAGYSDTEIADYLSQQSHFDAPEARKAGYDDSEIIHFLSPAVKPGASAPQQQPEESSFSKFWKGVATLVPSIKEAIGGLQRSAGEAGPITSDNPALAGDQSLPEPSEDLKAAYKTSAEHGAQIYKAAAEDIAKNAPHVAPGEHQSIAYQVGSAISQIAPIVGLTALTRNPEIGVELGANLIGAEAFGQKYGEAREENRSPTQAGYDAAFAGLTQGALARVPLGVLMKPGGTFLSKALQTAGAGTFQNAVTTALQEGYDAGIVHKDMPLGEAVQGVIDAGIVGGVTGGLLGVGEHGVKRVAGRVSGTPPEAPQAPPTGTPPRPTPTPEQAAAPVLAAPTIDAAIQAAQASLPEPIDIEAMGRQAQMQAESNGAHLNAERGINDLLGDFGAEEAQIEQEAGAQPQAEAPGAAVQPEAPASTPAAEEAPLPLAAAGEAPVEPEVDTPSLADTTELQGRVRGAPRRVTTGPVDAATFLALEGGIRNDEGHDLTAGRGLQQFIPGAGPLIRPGGMSIDAAGEALHQEGFFGPPDATPRPTENEVLQMLEQTGRDAQGRPGKVYTPEDQARLDEAQRAKHATDDNARALQDVHDEARALGESLEPHEADQVAAYMGEHGLNPEVAVGEFLERKYSRLAEEYHEQTGDSAYAEASPVTRGQGEIDLGHGEGLEGQEAVPFPESGGGEGRDAVAADSGPARQLATEPGAAGLDQTIIPGAEASARQLAQAREDAGHGRIQPRAQQKPADSGLFGDKPEPTLFARRDEEPAPPFFSGLTRAVEGVKMEKAPPGQWEATIKNLPGVKAEELDWSGVNDWLRRQTRSVTKAEVLQHLRENEVQVKEVEKGEPKPDGYTVSSAGAMGAGAPVRFATEAEAQAELARREREYPTGYHNVAQLANREKTTKFGTYVLPGGKNYRELVLTLPKRGKTLDEIATEKGYGGWHHGLTEAQKAEVIAEQERVGSPHSNFNSSHFDEPNILAHVRFDDRTGPNGEKVLHVSEIQSDWHQQGRRKGYRGEAPKPVTVTGFTPRELDYVVRFSDGSESRVGKGTIGAHATIGDVERYFDNIVRQKTRDLVAAHENGVPDAPFKNSWQELAAKRMLRYAAEHGYDRLSWDTGETNAARYDLSKQVHRIDWTPDGDRKIVTITPNDGHAIEFAVRPDGKVEGISGGQHGTEYDGKHISDVVGKDIGDKIVAETHGDLSGGGLKVGGEGMRGFYDRILPAAVSKLAKKWGAKVDSTTINNEPSGFTRRIYEGPRHTDEEVDRLLHTARADNLPVSITQQLRDYRDALSEGVDPKEASAEHLSEAAAKFLGGRMVDDPTAKVGIPVHSIAINDAMREGVMQGQPLFARREEVTGTFSPEFDAKRAEVAAGLRKRLDELGLHDIALKLPDAIETPEGLQDGAFRDKIIAVALDAKDHGGILDHEAIHALRALDLFKKSEWSILAAKAAREWRARYKIDERYGDFPEDRRNEEAVAEAFRYWVKGKGNQTGIIARLFDKMRNALSAVGNALRLRGFQTADSIFGKIDRGEVGARPGAAADPEAAMFARRNPPTEDEIYRDGVANLIQAAGGGEIGSDTGARLLSKVSEAGIKQIKNVNPLEGGSFIGSLFPRTLASLDDMSARLWRPWMAREEEGHATTEKLRRVISDSLVPLSAESRDRVYAALELARKWEWRPPDDGRPIRVRNTSYWQARKSKVGDDYVLNSAETKAFHDALKLGDEGWKTFMGAIARREGWKGAPDPEAIRQAANEKGEGLPEGKRLLRLADTIEAAQGAMNRPYFPAMRFGDYYIAVKPKIGTDEGSLGGYSKVEWFETVEKPAMHDLLGKSRVAAADMPEVKSALDRIKATKKADGSLAFTDDTHDFEMGDLRSRPNILRQLNLPAVEKLFMLMERGVTKDLRDKIMATNTPEEGATGKDAAGLKREAGEAAKAHYDATLGEAKDILLDAVYHDLLSGWKKHASLVPGYSEDFDRSIGTHLYQVGRNSADIIYRNDIEDAYQNIQDNHPHASTKQYWAHWRQYQETPQDALSRAAGKTAQIGAVYVMGLNPSTTMMIGAHTPVMATPVLGVGGGMGQATAQMMRAAREVYKELSFDKKKGGFIDASKLGRTDREKALLADLEKAGLTHSLGADDVRALNDRQAGLWGSAQPTLKKAMDIAMSNVSAVDQANRNAIALAAHRMAMNPATLEKMAKPWMEHSAIFRQMVMSEGLTPENFAKFMLSEGAGAWGRTNQAVAMRGAEGSLLFALHGFQTRFLSTAWKLMFNMGPAGKVAAGWMMAALWAGTGIYGLPFTEDLENAGTALWKQLTATDPMIDAHLRQFLQDAGLGKIGTEVLLRGPLSVMTGVDLGSRLGFGDVITRSFTASDLLGTIPSLLRSRMAAAYEREKTGQGGVAAAAELLPSALRSPARAAIEAKQGTVSQSGNMLRTAGQISTSDRILRSLGLPSLSETQARDRTNYLRDLSDRDKVLHEQTRNAWAEMTMRAARAQEDGDYALAHELSEEAGNLLQSYNTNHWQTPLDEKSLGDAMISHTAPEVYHLMKTPGRLRGEAYRNPY